MRRKTDEDSRSVVKFMENLSGWHKDGAFLELTLPVHRDVGRTARFKVFYKTLGESGPWLTLLHGFPSSSLDWAYIAPVLARNYRILAFDFLGFGHSDKPAGHPYSLIEQTEIADRLWLQLGVTETHLVAHDYGVSVAQEFLSRMLAGRQIVADIKSVTFLNGGLYRREVKPILVQKLLRKPIIGPLVARLSNGLLFKRSLASILAPKHKISDAELDLHWAAMKRDGGHKQLAQLIYYMTERDQHGDRWEDALENAPVPLSFIWGLCDPISGPLAPHIRARLPHAPFRELPDAGHYPQWETPEHIAELLRGIVSEVA
jgi:pimeloyl-ACP methyl ester carboxylesterase